MKTVIFFAFVLFLSVAPACKKEKAVQQPVVYMPYSASNLPESTHFRYTYDSLAASDFEEIKTALENNFDSICNRYQVKDIPKMRVVIWSNVNEYNRSHNYQYNGSAGYVVSRDEIRILFIGKQTASNAVHEFAHAITLHVSNSFGNNPRWLWEAIAVYEAGQFIDPKTLAYMVNKQFPSLQSLSGDVNSTTQIYDVGYTLADFIIKTWGYPRLVELIKSHGDLNSTLNIREAAFEARWHQYLEHEYFNK